MLWRAATWEPRPQQSSGIRRCWGYDEVELMLDEVELMLGQNLENIEEHPTCRLH
jgi:hypothetical protein